MAIQTVLPSTTNDERQQTKSLKNQSTNNDNANELTDFMPVHANLKPQLTPALSTISNLANSLSNLNLTFSNSDIEPIYELSSFKSHNVPSNKRSSLNINNSNNFLAKSVVTNLKKDSHRRHHSHGQFIKTANISSDLTDVNLNPNKSVSCKKIRT